MSFEVIPNNQYKFQKFYFVKLENQINVLVYVAFIIPQKADAKSVFCITKLCLNKLFSDLSTRESFNVSYRLNKPCFHFLSFDICTLKK